MRRILVTGSRKWTDDAVIGDALVQAWRDLGGGTDITLVSGACPTGADAIAESIWGALPLERHPADWLRYGKAAGPRRNQEMVELGADICLAFPLSDSRGTRHCMAVAERAGIPVRVYAPTTDAAEAAS